MAWRAIQNGGHADCALPTNRGNFHHAPILEDGQHRTKPRAGKVHVPDRFPGFVENLLELRRYGFERPLNAHVLLDWKSRQQAVWVPLGRSAGGAVDCRGVLSSSASSVTQ